MSRDPLNKNVPQYNLWISSLRFYLIEEIAYALSATRTPRHDVLVQASTHVVEQAVQVAGIPQGSSTLIIITMITHAYT
jgi:hypothetical protein